MPCEVAKIRTVNQLGAWDFESRFLGACEPVLVPGQASRWPALERWTKAYLREHAGELEVPYRRTPLDEAGVNADRVHRGFSSLSQVLDACEGDSEEETYVPGMALKAVPKLFDDIVRPGFLVNQALRYVSLFLGRNTRCVGRMHPFSQAVLTQVWGHKDVILYSPRDLKNLYMNRAWRPGFFQSRANFHALDPVRYPRVLDAVPRRVRLYPGDSLFIPVHWLHVPVGDAWSMSVTHRWRSKWREWIDLSAVTRSIVGGLTSGVANLAWR